MSNSFLDMYRKNQQPYQPDTRDVINQAAVEAQNIRQREDVSYPDIVSMCFPGIPQEITNDPNQIMQYIYQNSSKLNPYQQIALKMFGSRR